MTKTRALANQASQEFDPEEDDDEEESVQDVDETSPAKKKDIGEIRQAQKQ